MEKWKRRKNAKPNEKENETLDEIRDKLEAKGYDSYYQKGFSQVSIGVPFGDGKKAQVDFMVGSKKFASDAMSSAPSKYKGKWSAMLLGMLIKDVGLLINFGPSGVEVKRKYKEFKYIN